jgi:phage replication-related protein YjqB (UPF0714/DUF867 family)
MGIYSSFQALQAKERESKDFVILKRNGFSGMAVMAPHGGCIEPGTTEIADAVAGETHTFYAFAGIKKSGNGRLHIDSVCFDEPQATVLASCAHTVITVHGSSGEEPRVLLGGTNIALGARIQENLTESDFPCVRAEEKALCGIHPQNLCNRGTCGKGVQLEISRGLRSRLFYRLGQGPARVRERAFGAFVGALRQALTASLACG